MFDSKKIRNAKESLQEKTGITFHHVKKNARKYVPRFNEMERKANEKNRRKFETLNDEQSMAVMDKVCEVTLRSYTDVDAISDLDPDERLTNLTPLKERDRVILPMTRAIVLPVTRFSVSSPRIYDQFGDPSLESSRRKAMQGMPWCKHLYDIMEQIEMNTIRDATEAINIIRQKEIIEQMKAKQAVLSMLSERFDLEKLEDAVEKQQAPTKKKKETKSIYI